MSLASRFVVVAAILILSACSAVDPDDDETRDAADRPQRYVIHVSVDGLRSDAVTLLGADALPVPFPER